MVDSLVRASVSHKISADASGPPPSRVLTPYFVPGVETPGEEHINAGLVLKPAPQRAADSQRCYPLEILEMHEPAGASCALCAEHGTASG